MNELMKQEKEAAEEKAISNIASEMLVACDGQKIDHCIAAALSVVGSIINQHPEHTAAFVSSLRGLAEHIEKREAAKQALSLIVTH